MLTIVASDKDIAERLFQLPLDILLQAGGCKMLSQAVLRCLWWIGANQMSW